MHDAFSGWLTEPARAPEPPPSYQPAFTPPPVRDAQDLGRRDLPRRERSGRPLSDEGQAGLGEQPPGSPAAVDGTRPWWAPPGAAAGAGVPHAPLPDLPRRATSPGPPGSIMPFSLPGESGPADPSFNLFDSPSEGRSGQPSRTAAARAPEPAFPAPPPQVPIAPMPLAAGDAGDGRDAGPGGPLPRRQPAGGQPAYQPAAFQPPAPLPVRTTQLPAAAPQLPPIPPVPQPVSFRPAPPVPPTPSPIASPITSPIAPAPSVLPEATTPGLPQRRPERAAEIHRDPTPSNPLRELEDPPPATFAEVLNPTGKAKPSLGGYRPPRRPSNRLPVDTSSLTPFPDAADAGAAAGATGAAETGAGVAGAGLAAAQAAADRLAALAGEPKPEADDDGGTHIMPATTRRRRSQTTGRSRAQSPAETTSERRRSRHTGEQPGVSPGPDHQLEPAEPGPAGSEPAAAFEESHGRAGRNLPAAIAVGVVLAGLALASLFTRPEAFVALASLVVVLAVWELAGAMAAKQITVPVIPLAVGSLGMLVSAYVAGEEGLLVSFALTGFGVLLWRIIDGVPGAARDVTAGVFTAAYIPLLAGFAILLLADPDGPNRVVVFILVTVASDIGGYAAGVIAGRTPMAPTISPKKSWEGFAGSVVTCLIVGVACMFTLLDGPWWAGLAIGAAAAITATVGDLSESLIKRDLGVKDMGSLLPGHGGIMDRLDSLLPTAPVVFLLLHYLVT